ncbi:MFS transporter [Sphingobium sp. C100]|jgi:MFS transporter, ACS family, D-galactonate transporter|uniref:MFS transporter n=1 Tax=Sphingobium sp. C100 TaxID=1207055 RepID=UPI0003D5D265|nr:MFS transporter [Sphingobium sp. C100]ETI58861.1 MFS transporter [Sphingobium sp. C100]PHQ64086.1 MAG: MFS transporter [Sphingobium sp.]
MASTPLSKEAAAEPPARVPELSPGGRWLVLFLLATGVLIAFVDRTSISSALADPPFIAHFNLSDLDRGWLNSAFFWSYGLVQIPIGWVVDRYGVKTPYTICFVLWCVATAAIGLVDAFATLLLMRLLIGAAEAVVMPASYRWIRNNFSERQNGTAVGVFAMGNKFGPAIGAPVAAWLIVNYDWRTMFILTGAVGFIWLIPWILTVRNDWPSADERATARRKASSVSFASIMKSPLVWGAMIVNFCYGYFTFYCMSWMPAYLVEERGLSLKQSGLYTFFSFAGIAIVAVVAGWAADKLIERGGDPVFVRKAFVIAGFIGACTVLLGAYAPSLDMALFWNVFSLSFLGLATANNLALCRLTLIPKPAIGLVTGVQQVATSLAGGVAASLSGWLLHVSGGYDLPMLVIFVFLIIGAAATWILLRPEWAPKVSE